MGSVINNTPVKAHANGFDSQGRVVDNTVTGLKQTHGAFQETHNQANQPAANSPRWPNTNQDLLGAEAAGASGITTSY